MKEKKEAAFSGRICRRYCHLDGIKNELIKKKMPPIHFLSVR